MMRQAWHIFAKDTRQFRYPIAALLIWTAFFVAGSVSPWLQDPFARDWRTNLNMVVGALSSVVFPAAWTVLVALLIQAESLPGDRQFWLTRPYDRWSLLLGKMLFLVTHIAAPFALAQAAIVMFQGLPLGPFLPGFLWEQILIFIVILLPAVAIATLTSTLPQFLIFAILAPACWLAFSLLPQWAGLDWIRTAIATAALLALGLWVVVFQFVQRRTGSARRVALIAVLATVTALAVLPWRFAFAIQARMTDPWPSPLTAVLDRAPGFSARAVQQGRMQPINDLTGVSFNFKIAGLPDDSRLMCDARQIVIKTSEGRVWDSGLGVLQNSGMHQACSIGGAVPEWLPNVLTDDVVGLTGELYVTLFGPEERTTVTPGGSPTGVAGLGFCIGIRHVGPAESYDRTEVRCRSAFREPDLMLLAPQGLMWRTRSYSPFPATLRLTPVVQRSASLPDSMSLTSRQPIAHVRVSIQESEVRLRDFAW